MRVILVPVYTTEASPEQLVRPHRLYVTPDSACPSAPLSPLGPEGPTGPGIPVGPSFPKKRGKNTSRSVKKTRQKDCPYKNALYLSVNVFSTKVD